MFDGLNVEQARRHVQPEAPEGRRAGPPARRRMGRRGRRELRAARDARLRARLRLAGRGQARSRDAERVPERADRSAPQLPRIRRAGLGARGIQLPHRLARPRARRAARHHHRLARAPVRRDRARRRTPLPPPHRPRRVPRRLAGRGGDLLALPVAARVPGDGCRRAAGRATRRTGPSCTMRSPAPTRTGSAIAGSRSPRGPTRRPRRLASITGEGAERAEWFGQADPARRRRDPAGRGHRGRAGAGLRRPPLRPAARAPPALRPADPPVPRRRPVRAQRLPPLRRVERLRPSRARRSARTRAGSSPTCSASTRRRSPRRPRFD